MTLRDALERGVEDIAGCVPSLANVAALLVALCIERGPSRSSGVRVTTFSSAGRPPLLVRAKEVSALLEGSIRTTRKAPMRAEVEARPETSGEGQRGQGRPSPLSPDHFRSSARPRARKLCRSTHGEITCTQREVCNFRQRLAWLAEMMKKTQPTVPLSKKWIRPLPDHSDDGMER